MRTYHAWMLAGIALLPMVSGCGGENQSENVVVVYSSLDEEFARPLAEEFQKETGIEVRLVSDTEKAKSSGLLNRLLEEKDRPQCDVFLSEDPVRAAVLKKHGLFDALSIAVRRGAAGGVCRPRPPLDRHVGTSPRPAGEHETPALQDAAIAGQRL